LKKSAQAGFTLLEILLVIVMLAVTSAMVVPSLSLVSQGSVEDEAKRLRLVMSFAMEESQLSGVPLRWLAKKQSWSFESLEQGEEASVWQAFAEAPLNLYDLPEGVNISDVVQAGEFSIDMEKDDREDKRDEEPVIGMVLFLPDGATSQSNIHLAGEEDEIAILEIRPGPRGIRLKKNE
jgi:type II secretion system protein H